MKWLKKGEDKFWLHGFIIGLAYLPYMVAVAWWLILIRAIIIGLFMGLWCKFFSNDIVEECGRGAIITATLPLFLI